MISEVAGPEPFAGRGINGNALAVAPPRVNFYRVTHFTEKSEGFGGNPILHIGYVWPPLVAKSGAVDRQFEVHTIAICAKIGIRLCEASLAG